MLHDYTPKQISLFWSQVDKSNDPDSCWLWNGYIGDGNYGRLTINRKSQRAHRIAWILTFGEIHDGLLVCHTCDVRLCCNPRHLFLGTHLDNSRDMVNKNRQAAREKHSKHKLTEAQVSEIRRLYAEGNTTQRALAKSFDISQPSVFYILHNKHWEK